MRFKLDKQKYYHQVRYNEILSARVNFDASSRYNTEWLKP
jgi:hypothetical protein